MASSTLSRTKRALIFGNNNYIAGDKLNCCANDAHDISTKLIEIGFKVTIECDQSYADMTETITEFQSDIKENDLIVFFFSGHGVEWNGQTYLVPIDNQRLIKDYSLCRYQAVCAQEPLNSMIAARPFTVIFLLDCCRLDTSEPMGKSKATAIKSSSDNFMTMKGVAGSLIAFACGPNEKTFDKSPNRRNGLFTYHLLQHITEPNLKIEEIMCRVCDGVYGDSGGELYTYRLSCLRTSKIYLNVEEPTTTPRLNLSKYLSRRSPAVLLERVKHKENTWNRFSWSFVLIDMHQLISLGSY